MVKLISNFELDMEYVNMNEGCKRQITYRIYQKTKGKRKKTEVAYNNITLVFLAGNHRLVEE